MTRRSPPAGPLPVLAVLLSLALAGAAHADAGPCAQSQWLLDGAAAKPGPDAVFDPRWQPALDAAARCLEATPTACLGVRGQFDELKFGPGVEAAFGDGMAVQLSRARGRAEHIIARLHARGIAGDRLILQPPPMEPTWRGAALTVIEGCRPDPAAPAPSPSPAAATPAPPTAAPAAPAAPVPVVVDVRHPDPAPSAVALGVHAGTEALIGADATEWGGRTRLSVDWTPAPYIYTHLDLGLLFTEAPERAVGGEVMLGAGARPLPWLSAGVYGTAGQGAERFTDPWMHRTWAVGLEVLTCFEVADGTRICAIPRFAPYGQRARRFVRDRGTLFRVPQTTDRIMSAELAVGVTRRL